MRTLRTTTKLLQYLVNARREDLEARCGIWMGWGVCIMVENLNSVVEKLNRVAEKLSGAWMFTLHPGPTW